MSVVMIARLEEAEHDNLPPEEWMREHVKCVRPDCTEKYNDDGAFYWLRIKRPKDMTENAEYPDMYRVYWVCSPECLLSLFNSGHQA